MAPTAIGSMHRADISCAAIHGGSPALGCCSEADRAEGWFVLKKVHFPQKQGYWGEVLPQDPCFWSALQFDAGSQQHQQNEGEKVTHWVRIFRTSIIF